MIPNLSLTELGRITRNLLIRFCVYDNELNDENVLATLKWLAPDLDPSSLIAKFCRSSFFPRIFSARGQLARIQSINLVAYDIAKAHLADCPPFLIEFCNGLLMGADNLYGAFLAENSGERASKMVDFHDWLDSQSSFHIFYGFRASSKNILPIFEVNNQIIRSETTRDLGMSIIAMLSQIISGEYNEFYLRFSENDYFSSISGVSMDGDFTLQYFAGSELDLFTFGARWDPPPTVEVVTAKLISYASRRLDWWFNSNWFRNP